jgi:hypothetical protein
LSQPTPGASSRHNPGIAASVASVAFGALAGGALWCFVSVAIRYNTDALIIPIGFALGVFLRWQGFSGRQAMLCAAAATVLAFAYAQYLFGAVRIAQGLGFPLREALFKADFALIADVAWANLRIHDWVALAIAMLLGCAVAAVRAPAKTPS